MSLQSWDLNFKVIPCDWVPCCLDSHGDYRCVAGPAVTVAVLPDDPKEDKNAVLLPLGSEWTSKPLIWFLGLHTHDSAPMKRFYYCHDNTWASVHDENDFAEFLKRFEKGHVLLAKKRKGLSVEAHMWLWHSSDSPPPTPRGWLICTCAGIF